MLHKYKILYVIDNLEFGGGERGFLQIMNGLNKENFAIHVASHPGGEFGKKISEMRVSFLPVNMLKRYNLLTILKLISIISKKGIHIVHSQGARADFFARVAVRATHRPYLVSTIQMPVEGYNVSVLRKRFYLFFDRFFERYVDHFIVVSDSLKRTIAKDHQVDLNKISKVYNGIELDVYKPDVLGHSSKEIKENIGIKSGDFVLGAVGRLIWQKGFEDLICSLPQIVKMHPEVKLLIVGDGPLRKSLQELAKGLNVNDSIFFTGFRNDLKEILSSIDLLIIPSLLEGFPMITLEAMAMEKPIIATNIDGITEQITNEKDGILVPPKEPNEIAKAIMKLFLNQEGARRMASAARKKVEHQFSVKKMIAETEKVYLSILELN